MISDTRRSTLIQLVPQRTAEPNGLADYASALAHALRTRSGVSTIFLSGASAEGAPMQDEWKTVYLASRQARILADTLRSISAETDARAVILHYSGYGYQKRGAPMWLVDGLRIWRRNVGRIPLLTIFHELYASGRPWQSSFWLSPVQKRIARSILGLSSAAITPITLGREQLLRWNSRGGTDITLMPVFSNVGEPGRGSPPAARADTVVVFGLTGVEDRLYGSYRRQVEHIIMTLGIKKVLDLGPRLSAVPRNLAGIPIVSKGAMSRLAVSEVLKCAKFGLIAYPLDNIGKSGVFAAYASHGVVPILLSEKPDPFEGLEPGRHFLDGLRLQTRVNTEDLISIQDQLSTWYFCHSLEVQAGFIDRSINSIATQPDGAVAA
jgi:hypothetical protein